MIGVLEREDRVRGLEIVREQEPRPRAGPVDGDRPALQVRAATLLDEAQELSAQSIDRGRLEDRLDGVRDRHDELLHLRGEWQARIADRERGEEDVLQAARLRHEHLHEMLFAVVREVATRDERELRGAAPRERRGADARGRRDSRHHLHEARVVRVGVERRRLHAEDRGRPAEAANRLDCRLHGVLLLRRIELDELLVPAERRHTPNQNGGHDDGEDLADERLFLGMGDEPTPGLLGNGAGRADERRLPVFAVDVLLLGVGEAEIREHLSDAPLAIEVAALLVETEERVQRGVVARVGADPAGELGGILVGDVLLGGGGGRRVVGEVDLDADVRARVLEVVLQLGDLGLQELDPTLERQGALIGRRLEGHDRRRRRRIVHREVLDDDPVARLVGGLEGLLEAAEARAVEAEVVGHLVELVSLFLRDDPVVDHLRIELLVHRLQLAEADVPRDLTELESLTVLERGFVHSNIVAWTFLVTKREKKVRWVSSMHESIDQLFAHWQKNPDVAQTVALCHALRGTKRVDLVEIVGSHASRQLDVGALSAAARMYTDTGRLDDAQQVLIAAGRLAPRDGDVYGLLGEVLLRRGDAERAEKVLERALQLGSKHETSQWLDRARALLSTQQSSGMMAVAEEIGRAANELRTAEARPPASAKRPPLSDDDMETAIHQSASLKAADAVRAKPAPAAGRPALPAPVAPPPRGASPADSFDAALGNVLDLPTGANAAPQTGALGLHPGTMPFASSIDQPSSVAPSEPQPSVPPFPDALPPSSRAAAAISMPLPPQEPPVNPFLVPPKPPKPVQVGSAAMPEARDVLEALQIAGVFEPDGAVRPQAVAWTKPEAGKRRIGSYASLGAMLALIVGGAAGSYYYVTDRRAKAHVEAEGILAQVDQNLRLSDGKLLEPSEQQIGHAFDLDSRSQHAALTWLHERAMVGLLKGGENVAFEDATARAKEVGVEEKRLAFTGVASFIFQNDTGGAATAVAKAENKADDDAYFQLLAGTTFERAGDAHAIERYSAAAKIDPDLIIAQILLARATAVEGDPHQAAELAKQFRLKYPDRIEGTALAALAWAHDPLRGDPPPEAKDIVDKDDVLPAPLKAVPPAVRALLAIEQHKFDDAKTALKKGLAVSDTPGVAVWLGSIALTTGDEALARKGALAAVSYSAVYPPARMLAARVALLGARLDEALKASEELPPASPDVAIVTAAVAYEKLDGERMRAALDGLSDDAKKIPSVVPLVRAQQLLMGNPQALGGDKALDMADDDAPWADVVAMDFALDTGDVDLAHKIAAKWTTEPRPVRAVRLSRLARWDGKNDDADRLSRLALEGGTVTVRALAERVFVLVAMNKATDAAALFKAYPNVGGPLVKWLRAYAIASHGKLEEARAIISTEDPPPALAPLPARLIAASAFGAVKDTRKGGDYVKALATSFPNPDLAVAADKVGAGKIARKH